MEFLKDLKISADNKGTSTGAQWISAKTPSLTSISPVDGKTIATVTTTDKTSYDTVIDTAAAAFREPHAQPRESAQDA